MAADQCLPCPIGTFSGAEGAAQCSTCSAGSFVTLLTNDAADGLGTNSGGEACVACPAGRESTASGSVLCHSCTAGESSSEGEPAQLPKHWISNTRKSKHLRGKGVRRSLSFLALYIGIKAVFELALQIER